MEGVSLDDKKRAANAGRNESQYPTDSASGDPIAVHVLKRTMTQDTC